MTPEQFIKQLQRQQKEIVEAMRRTVPLKAAVIAEQHFKDNFRKGGFQDNGLTAWKPSTRIGKAKGAAGSYGTLLSGRNHLYSSIRHRTEPFKGIVWTDVPYAAAHNEGTNNAGRNHNVRLPKRQFIGDSEELRKKIAALVEKEINRILNHH